MDARRVVGFICITGFIAALASGCTTDPGASQDASLAEPTMYAGPVGESEDEINILAWPGYAENGSIDPDIDWVTPFSDETGCKANVKIFGTSDEAEKLMETGEWDVVSASGDSSLHLVARDLVQPINTDLLVHYPEIFGELKGRSWNSVGDHIYGIPHGRGANVLVFNADRVSPRPDSWSIMFDENSPFAGKIGVYDSPISIADAALYLMATRPELKITDPYSLDATQFAAVLEAIEKQEAITSGYWSDYRMQETGFSEGSMVASTSWQVYANSLKAENFPVDVVKPKEGVTGWSDSWMIGKDTPNIDCAYKWLDWITSPKVNATAAEYFGQAPANSRACEFTADTEHCASYHAEDSEYWSDVYYWSTPQKKCLDGRTDVECVPYSEWVRAWADIRR